MTSKPTTKKFYQLVDIKDFTYIKGKACSDIDYGEIASDCDTKTISIFEAINHISLSIFGLSEAGEITKEKLGSLTCVIADLAELGIATNKIAQTAAYLSGVQDGNNGA